jgi:SynChlorMet cassette radical SAM/SPASM protein ScmF
MNGNENKEYPLASLYLYLTGVCNLRCSHCWIAPGFSSQPQDGVPLDILKKTIREAKGLGLRSVKLTGGEPLLYREFEELLAFLRDEELTVWIETNGTLFDRSLIDALGSDNIDQISVSLDAADEKVHEDIRGVKGSYRRTVEGLRLLSKHRLGFQVIMTLQHKNQQEIPALVQLCKELGAASLKINHLLPCGRAKNAFQRKDNLALEELIEYYGMVERRWPRGEGLDIIFDLPVAMRSIEDITQRELNECKILNIISILANGDYSICGVGQTAPELRMGSVFSDRITAVWHNHPVLQELRNSLPIKLAAPCCNCLFRHQCLGTCRANAFTLTGDLYAPYFLCRSYYDSGRFPASRLTGFSGAECC